MLGVLPVTLSTDREILFFRLTAHCVGPVWFLLRCRPFGASLGSSHVAVRCSGVHIGYPCCGHGISSSWHSDRACDPLCFVGRGGFEKSRDRLNRG